MSAAQAKVLFVDDEARVLTAMRAMFRRHHEVHIANSGAEALELLRDGSFDVVVSDQRMPNMTGVELLQAAREVAPRTMRLLLTGYADLAAIERAINDAEVFRYLMKPCPRQELKDAVAMAAEAARGAVADTAALEAPLAEAEAAAAAPAAVPASDDVGFLVLSTDDTLARGVRDAVGQRQTVRTAASMEGALEVLSREPVGVVVTDLAVDETTVSNLTMELRRAVPDLVTIVASERSDAHLLINLINHGQVFRFLLKPLSIGQCRIWLSSAVKRHRELLGRPGATQRYRGAEPAEAPADEGVLGRMLQGLRVLRRRLRADRRVSA